VHIYCSSGGIEYSCGVVICSCGGNNIDRIIKTEGKIEAKQILLLRLLERKEMEQIRVKIK
jgi:hypothetical protein